MTYLNRTFDPYFVLNLLETIFKYTSASFLLSLSTGYVNKVVTEEKIIKGLTESFSITIF